MPSEDPSSTKVDIIETATTSECISLTIPIDSSAENAKSIPGTDEAERCDDLGTTESDLSSCVLKELVCTTTASASTNVLSASSQILNSTDGIGTLSQSVSFDTPTAGEILLDGIRPNEAPPFSDNQGSTEVTLPSCSTPGHDVTTMPINPDLPPWAARLKDCEMIGDAYRGYVNTEAELDLLLSIHKEHTRSCWGTRQSPSSAKPSVRLMWKSQYVPYDGIPFLNSGRRATVMECQYGPRRKGNKVKVEFNDSGQPVKRAHRPTCPARIYIKKVRKFPEYRIDPNYEGTAGTRQAQERALAALRCAGIENGGDERFYIQFPLEIAHEYHHEDDEVINQPVTSIHPNQIATTSRLDYRVVAKINELVARGVTGTYEVKHGVIDFVEKELFVGRSGELPSRHNKTYFPTITDLQNHIHQAKLALEDGTLTSLPPPEAPPKLPRKDERNRKRKRSEPRRVRAPKATTFENMGAICVPADQLEVNGDGNLQAAQGSLQVSSAAEQINQLEGPVFVMVPSSNSLFTTSDSGIGSSLNTDKTTSLIQMQVVTVPAASTYLGQQADGTLGLAGQYLSLPVSSLPVVGYGENHDISTSESETVNDPLSKDIATLMPSAIDDQTAEQETLSHHARAQHNPTSTVPISPDAITVVAPDIATCENTSDATMTNSVQSFTKTKEPVILDAIGKNTSVDYLFVGESQMTKPDAEFAATNTDMNSIPCYTEESYNSSLNIIKTHAEITTAPSSTTRNHLLKETCQNENSNMDEELVKVHDKDA